MRHLYIQRQDDRQAACRYGQISRQNPLEAPASLQSFPPCQTRPPLRRLYRYFRFYRRIYLPLLTFRKAILHSPDLSLCPQCSLSQDLRSSAPYKYGRSLFSPHPSGKAEDMAFHLSHPFLLLRPRILLWPSPVLPFHQLLRKSQSPSAPPQKSLYPHGSGNVYSFHPPSHIPAEYNNPFRLQNFDIPRSSFLLPALLIQNPPNNLLYPSFPCSLPPHQILSMNCRLNHIPFSLFPV